VTRPLITLTTDFGEESYYLGALRGVLLSFCPEATLVDITHHVPPHGILEGAFVLAQACPRFPAGTVHLAVVDPGVGGARRPLLLRSGGHWYVGPDNGLFSPFLDGAPALYRIHDDPTAGATFHGRDVFAPAAARLARGEAPESLGTAVADPVRLSWPRPARRGGEIRGEVLLVDRFGNLVTTIRADDLPAQARTTVTVGSRRVEGLRRTYADAAPGELIALVGSSGFLEVAVVQGHAARTLGVARGAPVVVDAA
jgi:hypothetical protein